MNKPTLKRLAQLSAEVKFAQKMNEPFQGLPWVQALPCAVIVEANELDYLLQCADAVQRMNRLSIKD